MKVKAEAYQKHKEAIDTLSPGYQDNRFVIIQPDDIIDVKYNFHLSYHGVVQQLQAVKDLCEDPDVVVTADCAALEAGRILVYETLKKFDSIIQHVKGRE